MAASRTKTSSGAATLGVASNATTAAYVKAIQVKASGGKLYGFSGYNSGSAQFIQVHDSATTPVDGAIPAVLLPVAATAVFSMDWGEVGRGFTNGIYMCLSSTGPTKTLAATADAWMDAQYD